MRSFIAIPIPKAVKEYIVGVQEFLQQRGVKAKWVRPESSHLTLLFLGEQDQSSLDNLRGHLENAFAGILPLTLQQSSMGTFGRLPRVLYLAYSDTPPGSFKQASYAALEAARAASLPLPGKTGNKEPVAHLTLARFRQAADAKTLHNIGRRNQPKHDWDWSITLPEPPKTANPIPVNKATLYKSTLTPEGAEYDVIYDVFSCLSKAPAKNRLKNSASLKKKPNKG